MIADVMREANSRMKGAIASLEALPEVVEVVGERAEVYVDGGVRRGTDVVLDTVLRRDGDRLLLEGEKFYCTGTLYADLVDVVALDEDGNRVSVLVETSAPGVERIDDWRGFGQKLTASGTTHSHCSPVCGCTRPRRRACSAWRWNTGERCVLP